MLWSFLLILLTMMFGATSILIRNHKLRRIQKMFVSYNENKDLGVIVSWIQEKSSAARMADSLDYLQKINAEDLGIQVYESFPFDHFTGRHVRMFACQAYKAKGNKGKATQLAQRLLEAYPNDDSILDLFFEIHLAFDEPGTVKPMLAERLGRKVRGTTFDRHEAKLAAMEKDFQRAVTIMERVAKRDYVLYKNTMAPMAKKLIYQQYVESQKLLDGFKKRLEIQTD